MKRLLASAAFLALLCHCGSSSGGGPTNDAGSGFALDIINFDNWCTVTLPGNEGASSFAAGTVVALHATGMPGFTFAYWLGTDGAGSNGEDINASSTVTMNADKTVLACCNSPTESCPTSL